MMFVNEMQCLSNAVLQQCFRDRFPILMATHGIVPLVRRMVTDNSIRVEDVVRVDLHQCQGQHGLVNYNLFLLLEDGGSCHMTFQGSGLEAEQKTFRLYDHLRDGKAKYLYLVH